MTISRYKKQIPIIIILLFLIISTGIASLFAGSGGGFLLIAPVGNSLTSSFIISAFTFVGVLIGSYIGGYLLGPLFLYAHKNTIGKKMIYGIQEKEKDKEFKGVFLKALFPALLATNLALILSQNPTVQALSISAADNRGTMLQMFTISAILPLVCGIALGLFSGVWILQDAGIVYSNTEKVKDKSAPSEVKSVGGWYMYLLKGYAGISVIFNYLLFFQNLNTTMGESSGVMRIMFYIFWPIMPIMVAILMIHGIILQDLTFEKRRVFMRNAAKKQGITEPLASI